MSQETTYEKINELGSKMSFESVNLRLAIILEENQWKIFLARAVFESKKAKGETILHNQDDFAIMDFSMPMEDFNKFLEYLKRANASNVKLDGGKIIANEELFYNLGIYKLCFAGSITNGGMTFLRRTHAKGLGIDHPVYFTQYLIHSSVMATSYQRIKVIGQKIPFTDVHDAINHYWDSNYEPYSTPTDFIICMPVYDANIESCFFTRNGMIVKIDVDITRIKPEELSVSIVVDKKVGDYRKILPVHNDEVIFDIDFDPAYARIFLNKGKEMLDEYYYTSNLQLAHQNQVFQQAGVTVLPSESLSVSQTKVINENVRNLNPIFKGRNFFIEQDLCFILMPFKMPFTKIFESYIKPTLTKAGFRVMKADDIFKSTPIVEDIWEHINKARLIIADVTEKNPNVFYELGISHTVGTEVIIITQHDKDFTFDLTHYRHFRYQNTEEGLVKLGNDLEKAAKALKEN